MKPSSKSGVCTLADPILLRWANVPFGPQLMTQEALKSPKHLQKNPQGQVPMPEDGDFLLSQDAAIMGDLGDCFFKLRLDGDGSPCRSRALAGAGPFDPASGAWPAVSACAQA